MKSKKPNNSAYIEAKKKVRQLKMFYLHLAGYIIAIALIIWNLCIVEGPYAEFFTWFNSFCIVAWTIFIILHGWSVFKGRIFFRKTWQDRKIEAYLNKDKTETKMWE